MRNPNDETRVVLIGGSSHVGKSTLGRAISATLGWEYVSTDKLARHPGFPWVGPDGKPRPADVIEHYRNLPVEALLADVLAHYQKNVLPQVEVLVENYRSDSSTRGLVIEGSAIWPEWGANLARQRGARAIWLAASDRLFRDRIERSSRFEHANEEEQYLIQKFLDRTQLYNRRMKEKIEQLGLPCLDVESVTTPDELLKKSLRLMDLASM